MYVRRGSYMLRYMTRKTCAMENIRNVIGNLIHHSIFLSPSYPVFRLKEPKTKTRHRTTY